MEVHVVVVGNVVVCWHSELVMEPQLVVLLVVGSMSLVFGIWWTWQIVAEL